uniref:Uncharacterized protein n=1 Tax=Cannabis sativa TaxID=3483 RepID=A0A803QTQ8_CANSA
MKSLQKILLQLPKSFYRLLSRWHHTEMSSISQATIQLAASSVQSDSIVQLNRTLGRHQSSVTKVFENCLSCQVPFTEKICFK